MAQREITELPLASTPDGNELALVRQGANDKKVTLDTIKDYVATELSATFLDEDANLSDVADAAAARANLGIQSTVEAEAAYLEVTDNLSDVSNASAAFSNIKQSATTTTSGVAELATNAETIAGTDATRATTPAGVKAAINDSVVTSTVSVKGVVELATNAETIAGTDATRATTPASVKAVIDNRVVSASTSTKGISELATNAETVAGTDATRATTPASVKAAIDNSKTAATVTSPGIIEIATSVETVAGVDNTRAITPALLKGLLDEMFVSQISSFPVGVPLEGWLKCDGAAVSRTTYSRLFAKIGTVYGSGDGSSTFNVPDLRGEFLRAFDDGKGVDSGRVLGSVQTESSLHVDEFDTTPSGQTNTTPASIPTNGNYSSYRASGRSNDNNNAGIRFKMNAAETRPRNIALLYCIKY